MSTSVACEHKGSYRCPCIFQLFQQISISQFVFSLPTYLCWLKYHLSHSNSWEQIVATGKDTDTFWTNMLLIKLLIYLNLGLCCSHLLSLVSSLSCVTPWPCFFCSLQCEWLPHVVLMPVCHASLSTRARWPVLSASFSHADEHWTSEM